MTKIRTLLIEDEPLGRERLRTLLEPETDIEIVGECDNGVEAVAAVAELAPDLLFLDVQLPEFDGFEVLERVRASTGRLSRLGASTAAPSSRRSPSGCCAAGRRSCAASAASGSTGCVPRSIPTT